LIANILPAFIFRYKRIIKKPVEELKKIFVSFLRSVAFFTFACSLPPTINCHMQRMFGYTGRMPGFLSQILGMCFVCVESI